jgi:erythromycin esterase-like protein
MPRRARFPDPPDDLGPVSEALRQAARPLAGDARDHDALLDVVGDRPIVLLGEGSHGTHEFYALRAEITARLVEEKGFDAGGHRGRLARHRPRAPLGARPRRRRQRRGGARRLPPLPAVDVAQRGVHRPRRAPARPQRGPGARPPGGVHGLDLYSLHNSIDEVLRYLDEVDPEAARRARARYGCFEEFGEDPQEYGYAAAAGESCEEAVVEQLVELLRRAPDLVRRDADPAGRGRRLLLGRDERAPRARRRALLPGDVPRAQRELEPARHAHGRHARRARRPPAAAGARRARWWCGRTTPTSATRAPPSSARPGSSTSASSRASGTATTRCSSASPRTPAPVTAAHDWGDPARRMRVNPSLPGSVERALHDTGLAGCVVPLRGSAAADAARAALDAPLLERRIGVIYRRAPSG